MTARCCNIEWSVVIVLRPRPRSTEKPKNFGTYEGVLRERKGGGGAIEQMVVVKVKIKVCSNTRLTPQWLRP